MPELGCFDRPEKVSNSWSPHMRLVALTLAGLITAGAAAADRADTLSIVGSSTVYPFATAVAEAFGETTDFNTPVIRSTGSGGGMKLFCAGVGLDHPDVTNASRRQKSSEAETCAANGVEFTEFMIGYDGIVLANSKNGGPALDMSKMQIAMGVLAEIPNADCTDSPRTHTATGRISMRLCRTVRFWFWAHQPHPVPVTPSKNW